MIESKITNLLHNPAVGGMVLNSRDVTDRKQAEAKLVHDALHDALTGLPNRALFMDRLGHCLDRIPRRSRYRCAVLFLDLDRFKMVNDSLGHAIGDLLLIEASRRLTRFLRPTDTLARLGSDEFVLLLDDVADASNAVRVARCIQEQLQAPFELSGREVFSTASIGIAMSTPETRDGEELLRDADTAMYRAKAQGRAGYAIFDSEMHAQVTSQLQLETDLRRALEKRQVEVFYQPLVILQTGAVAGLEALARWRHPEHGLMDAGSFVPPAEETGLLDDLDRFVVLEACRQMRDWNDRQIAERPLFVTVNLCRRQLVQSDLVGWTAEALGTTGLEGDRLYLEITESALAEDPETVRATLTELHRLGIRFALDDFGTGHSSLSVLHHFLFDQVKIDPGFAKNVDIDRGSDELVEGVLALCHWRRLRTVAEGVETEEQRRKLAELDCTSMPRATCSRSRSTGSGSRSCSPPALASPRPERIRRPEVESAVEIPEAAGDPRQGGLICGTFFPSQAVRGSDRLRTVMASSTSTPVPSSTEELEALIRQILRDEIAVLVERSRIEIEHEDKILAREAAAIWEADGDRPEAWMDWEDAKAEILRAEAAGELPD